MPDDPYSDVPAEQMILRDRLAADRTVLANERTLLAYARTALAMAAGGGSLVHFFQSLPALLAGWTLIAAGGAAMAVGVWRYRTVRRDLRSIRSRPLPGTTRER